MYGSRFFLGSLILSLSIPAFSWGATYEIITGDSSVGFTVKHMMIGRVHGKFKKFSGSFEYDPEKKDMSKVVATIQAGSIDTSQEKRDKHLRSADFFEVEKFPTVKFESKKVVSSDEKSMKIEGELTMRGVTKPVVLDVEIGGVAKDPWGNGKAAFTGKTTIHRKDFGLKWNKALESGGVLVGDEVDIVLEIEGDEKAVKKTKQ